MTTELPPNPTSPSRRHWLVGGVAALAALAGAGLAWRRSSLEVVPDGSGPGAGVDQPLWALTLDAPGGEPVALDRFRGKPLLVNFWATWCPPCVEELPLLNRFYSENAAKSWQVLGIAIDQPSAVRKFLQKMPLDFPVVMGGLEGTEISRSMGNLGGSLPFTAVLDGGGKVVHRKIGALGADELQALVAAHRA